jgi:hypothetical protein
MSLGIYRGISERPWSDLTDEKADELARKVYRYIFGDEPEVKFHHRLGASKGHLEIDETSADSIMYMGGKEAFWSKVSAGKGEKAFAYWLSSNMPKYILLPCSIDEHLNIDELIVLRLKDEKHVSKGCCTPSSVLHLLFKEKLEGLPSIRNPLEAYMRLVDCTCNGEAYQYCELRSSDGPLLISAMEQILGQEFSSFERSISELPDEYARLLKRFTRIIDFEESLKKSYLYIHELANMHPSREFSWEEIPTNFKKFLKNLNRLEDSQGSLIDLVKDLAMFIEQLLYIYAGNLILYSNGIYESQLNRPMLALQYNVNALNTSLQIAWTGHLTNRILDRQSDIDQLLGRIKEVKFKDNGLEFRFEGDLKDEDFKNSALKIRIRRILTDLQKLRSKRNKSPLSHGFIYEPSGEDPSIRDIEELLQLVKEILKDGVEYVRKTVIKFRDENFLGLEHEEVLSGEAEKLKRGAELLSSLDPGYFLKTIREVRSSLEHVCWVIFIAENYECKLLTMKF